MNKEDKARRQFEEATRRNYLRGQHQIATGEFVPEEEHERRRKEREKKG